jgi:hypothetical protein
MHGFGVLGSEPMSWGSLAVGAVVGYGLAMLVVRGRSSSSNSVQGLGARPRPKPRPTTASTNAWLCSRGLSVYC